MFPCPFTGLIAGGISGFKLLGIQLLAALVISAWTAVTAFITLKALDITIGLRVPLHEEILGADLVEHSLNGTYDKVTSEWRDREGHLIMVVKQYDNESTKDMMARIESTSCPRCECIRSPGIIRSSMRRRRSAFGFSRSDDSVSHVSDASDFIQEYIGHNKAVVEGVDGTHKSPEHDSNDNKKHDSQNHHTSVFQKLRKTFGSVTSKRSDSYDLDSSPQHLPNGSASMIQVNT